MAKTPRETKSVKEPSYQVNTGEADGFTAVISGLDNIGSIVDSTGLSKGLSDFIGKTNADIRQQTYADWAKNKIASKIASDKAKIDMANARANHNRSGGSVQYLGGTGVFTHPHSVGQPVKQYSSVNEYLGKTISKKHAEVLAANNAPYSAIEFGRWEGQSRRGKRDYSIGGPNSVSMFNARYGEGSHLNPTGRGILGDATLVSRGSNLLHDRRANRYEGPQHWIGQTGPSFFSGAGGRDGNFLSAVGGNQFASLPGAEAGKRYTNVVPNTNNAQGASHWGFGPGTEKRSATRHADAIFAKMRMLGTDIPYSTSRHGKIGDYGALHPIDSMANNTSKLAMDRHWFGREGSGSNPVSNIIQNLNKGMKEFTDTFTNKVTKVWRSPPPSGSMGDGIARLTKTAGTGSGGHSLLQGGGEGGSSKTGGFFGQVGQQFRHAAIWQTYTPFIAAAGVAAAHYTGISDPADRAAHRLVGVNYNRGQRSQIYNQALEAEASRAYTKASEVIIASKEVASNLDLGKSSEDLKKVGKLAIMGGHYAIQAEQEPKQAIRTLSRIATQLKRNVPELKGKPVEDLFENTASALGTIQETSSVTGPEMTGFTQRASASLAKLGWHPGEIIAYGAHMIEGGIPYGELGVFSKKMGVGALSEKIAYTNLVYEETKKRAAEGKGAVSGAIPSHEQMQKILKADKKNKGVALMRESERINAAFWSGDPKQAFDVLTKYSNRFHELSAVGGFPAAHLAERQSYNFLQNLYDMPEEAKEAMYSKLDKGKAAWNDVHGFRQKVEDAGKVETPAEEWGRLGGAAYKQLSFMGRNARTTGRNTYANQLTAGVNNMGNASQLSYAMRNKDLNKTKEIESIAEQQYREGIGDKVDINTKRAVNTANLLQDSKGQYMGGNLPGPLGGIVNIAGDLAWYGLYYGTKMLLDDKDKFNDYHKNDKDFLARKKYRESLQNRAMDFVGINRDITQSPDGSQMRVENGQLTMLPKSVGGGPLGTNIRPEMPGYKDMNDPSNWASNNEDPAWRKQLSDKQSIDVNAMNAPQFNISQPSLDYLIAGLQNGGGGQGVAGAQPQRVIVELKGFPPGTTVTPVNPAPTSPNAQPAGQAPPQGTSK